MAKVMKFFTVTIVLLLGFIVVEPYQYGMSDLLFYMVTIGCIVFSILLIVVIKKRNSVISFMTIACLLLLTVFSIREIYDQKLNFKVQQKITYFLPNAPIDIVGFSKLDPATLSAHEFFLHDQQPFYNLSEMQGSRTVYLKKLIPPGQSVDQYIFRFKGTYAINGLNVSKKYCSSYFMCAYFYTGAVLINPDTGDLLGLSVENSGGSK